MPLGLTYFAATTLTTIGLGDYHPSNSLERIFGTMMMVIGVSMFTLINDKVNRAISKLRYLTNPLDELQNQLEQFFGVLKQFNLNHPIEKSIRDDIQTFFEFRWENDKT